MSTSVNARMQRWVLATVVLAWWSCVPAAIAQVALETVDNAVVASSGAGGNGPAADDQVVTLRHNPDNPAGNAMVARTPAITVTYRLTNQQYTGLTDTQGYTAATGRNAVFFGGSASPTDNTNPSTAQPPNAGPIYHPFNVLATASADMFTSVGSAAGTGIDLAANAGVRLLVSTDAISTRAPVPPTSQRVRMADLEIRFSAPVTNPVLHFVGMGGATGSPFGSTNLGISAEFDVLTAGVTLTRLSGNTPFVVSGAQINSTALNPRGSCATNAGACGSVRINGTALSLVTLRVNVRGDGAYTDWNGSGTDFNGDGVVIGVSLHEPTPTVTAQKVTTGGAGTFTFSGSNGIANHEVATATEGTAVSGVTQTLTTTGTSTTLTEGTAPGYRLTDISCSGLGSGGTATVGALPAAGVAGGGTVTLSATATAFNSNILCTFSNEKLPIIRLQKVLPNGRIAATDQFTLRIASGATILQSATTTGADGAPAQVAVLDPAAVGTTYTLSEIAAGGASLANYVTTYRCTNALSGGQAPSGSGTSFTVTPVAGDDLTCTFTNVANQTDVSILKTVDEATRLPGQSVQFTLLVTNNGAVDASGTQVRDAEVPGLACTTVTCSASGAAICPAAPSVAALQSASGLTLPSLPPGGIVSLVLGCTVTASGF